MPIIARNHLPPRWITSETHSINTKWDNFAIFKERLQNGDKLKSQDICIFLNPKKKKLTYFLGHGAISQPAPTPNFHHPPQQLVGGEGKLKLWHTGDIRLTQVFFFFIYFLSKILQSASVLPAPWNLSLLSNQTGGLVLSTAQLLLRCVGCTRIETAAGAVGSDLPSWRSATNWLSRALRCTLGQIW